MKYTSYLTMLAVLLAAACTKDDITETVTQPAPENAISFSGQMKPADGDASAPGTRTTYGDNGTAITVEWAEGDEIGVFAKAGDELIASNYGYRTRSAGKETTFGFMIYDDAVCWADETTGHDFYAYYPYSKTEGDKVPDYTAVPVTLPAEQVYDPADPQGQFAALDFMYAAATGQTQAAVGQGSVPLRFSHLFSILEVKVTTDRFATIDGIVLRCKDSGEILSYGDGTTVDLSTGTVTPAETGNGAEIRVAGTQSTKVSSYTTWQMMISSGHADKEFEVLAMINDKEQLAASFTVPAAGLAAGKTYCVTVDGMKIADEDAETIVDLSADGTANCYYVTQPNTLYRFNASVKGNGEALSIDGLSYSEADLKIAPESALVLWYNCLQTSYSPWQQREPIVVASLGLEEDGYVYFRTPETFVPGNVVVIALDEKLGYEDVEAEGSMETVWQISNANVLWSWNLVVTDYDPDDTANQITHGGYTIMDRNLGAVVHWENTTRTPMAMLESIDLAWTTGNCYQWGRKDPFPGTPDYMSNDATYMSNLWFSPAFTPVNALDRGLFIPPKDYIASRTADHQIFGVKTETVCLDIRSSDYTSAQIFGLQSANPHLWIYRNNNGDATNKMFSDAEGLAAWGNPSQDVVGQKTIYDPCPPGWKVMTKAAWMGITDNRTAAPEFRADQTGRGVFLYGKFFPLAGNATLWHNSNAAPDGNVRGGGHALYFVDGPDADKTSAHVVGFGTSSNFFDEGGDMTITQVANDTNSDRGAAVRCMKIPSGQAVPGGDIDGFEGVDW